MSTRAARQTHPPISFPAPAGVFTVAGDNDRPRTMSRLPNVRLDLSNRAENVLLIREALTGIAEVVGLDGNDLSDIRTAVTEAANNVVLHAYAGEEGPLEVEIELT